MRNKILWICIILLIFETNFYFWKFLSFFIACKNSEINSMPCYFIYDIYYSIFLCILIIIILIDIVYKFITKKIKNFNS